MLPSEAARNRRGTARGTSRAEALRRARERHARLAAALERRRARCAEMAARLAQARTPAHAAWLAEALAVLAAAAAETAALLIEIEEAAVALDLAPSATRRGQGAAPMTPDELLRLYPRETLRWLRRQLELTQLALGLLVGTGGRQVARWEARHVGISPRYRARLAALLAPHLATPEGAAFARSLTRGAE
jgi:hypothetical protein